VKEEIIFTVVRIHIAGVWIVTKSTLVGGYQPPSMSKNPLPPFSGHTGGNEFL
jgi:hypothetical protein